MIYKLIIITGFALVALIAIIIRINRNDRFVFENFLKKNYFKNQKYRRQHRNHYTPISPISKDS